MTNGEEGVALQVHLSCDDDVHVHVHVALFQIDDDVTPLSVNKLIRLNHHIDCPVSWLAHPNPPPPQPSFS